MSGKPTILLVDDLDFFLEMEKDYLSKTQAEIRVAKNGREALEMTRRLVPDLIYMDVQMPIMDGHTATREIRAFEAASGAAGVPVIALTAHAIKEDMDKSIEAGCTAHLTKPIKKQTLLAALEEHLEA